MAWHFVLIDTSGNALGELTAAKAKKAIWPLDAAASASFTIDGLHPQAALIEETATDLLVYDDAGTKWFRGRLGSSGDAIATSGHLSTFSAVDYRGFMGRRLLRAPATLTFTVEEQAQIAWTLINDSQSQPSGSLGITQGTGSPTGQSRSYTFSNHAKIGDLLDQIAKVTNGFEYEIDANLRFNVFSPQRGSDTAVVLEYGGTVIKAQRTLDTSTFANFVAYSGATGLTPIEATSTPAPGVSNWETAIGDTSILDQLTLVLKANYELDVVEVLTPSYQLTLRDGWWTPETLWLGDSALVVVKSGRINDIFTERVTQIEVDINDDGGDTVTITTGPVPTAIEQDLTGAIDRISVLEVAP